MNAVLKNRCFSPDKYPVFDVLKTCQILLWVLRVLTGPTVASIKQVSVSLQFETLLAKDEST